MEKKPKTPDSIARENAEKVVQIVYGWQLYDATYNEIWQEYIPAVDSATKKKNFSALFIRNAEGKIEPYLDLKKNLKQGNPIGVSRASCTGFVVSNDGYILTTSAANSGWNRAYHFPETAFPGSLVSFENGKRKITPGVVKLKDVFDWVPANASMIGGRKIATGQVKGKNTFLDVLFAGTSFHRPVFSSITSMEHGISILKVDVPGALDTVVMKDNLNEIQPGVNLVVFGYTASKRSDSIVIDAPIDNAVPVSKISLATLSKIIVVSTDHSFFGATGDVFTLNMNDMDDSQNGAPVFNSDGDVIGIFDLRIDENGFKMPLVIPIKYAIAFKEGKK